MRLAPPTLRVLLVDDEPAILRALKRGFAAKRPQWSIVAVPGSVEAMAQLEGESFDIIISDFEMPTMNGIELLKVAKRLQPGTLRVIVSGCARQQAGTIPPGLLHAWLSKLYSVDELVRQCEEQLAKRVQRRSRARSG